MKRILLSTIVLIAFGFGTNAQNVNIPDVNFKNYLVTNSAINTNSDAEIQVSEANAFGGTIDCSNLGVSDLTGMEAFISVTAFYCENNGLTTMDVTQNVALTQLIIGGNNLASIDVTQNTALTYLYCQNNNLSSLDVSQNIILEYLYCFNNSLSILNLADHTALVELNCAGNVPLSMLNIANGNNINLPWFDATSCPSLTCIQVDDVAWSTTNWLGIDAGTSFSTDCGWGLGIEGLIESIDFKIYPNPTSTQITLETIGEIEKVLVFNTVGLLVQTEYSESFSVENLPTGVYVVNIRTNDGVFLSRFVKE
ncbi:MAG: T9SS type A sorting domain-containing protein [Crocinitomicaceae bacterium]|nr:T9SS type A sorting domain-containing protein [Crocinitomicaceae bacterium]